MKATQETIDRFNGANFDGLGNADWEDGHIRAGLEAALAAVPDVVPFTLSGYPDDLMFIHGCGAVIDVVKGSDAWDQVQAGECDCENTGPWERIYVLRDEK